MRHQLVPFKSHLVEKDNFGNKIVYKIPQKGLR